jgi:hypothetical protein
VRANRLVRGRADGKFIGLWSARSGIVVLDVLERSMKRFDLYPAKFGDSAYGAAEMLHRLVNDQGIEHAPVFDKSARTDGTFSRHDFGYDHPTDIYVCPPGRGFARPARSPITISFCTAPANSIGRSAS